MEEAEDVADVMDPDQDQEQHEQELEKEQTELNYEKDQVEDEKIVDNPLNQEIANQCIFHLCKTKDGLSHAFIKFYCIQKAITNISYLSTYIHLRHVDLSYNLLDDLSPLAMAKDLLTLNCSRNRLSELPDVEWPFLQELILDGNRIVKLPCLKLPSLQRLSINDNRLTSLLDDMGGTGPGKSVFDPISLPQLHTLELRNNHLTSTAGIHLDSLKVLMLANNRLTSLDGLSRLVHLTTLHLRANQLKTLDGFADTMRNLQYINLRNNQVATYAEMTKLQCLPLLRAVVLSDNPVALEDDYRLEVLIALRRITQLDDVDYADEEREEAEQIADQRRQELATKMEQEVVDVDESEDPSNE